MEVKDQWGPVFLPIKACCNVPNTFKKRIDRGRTRTCNPQIRSLVPYPLGHTVLCGRWMSPIMASFTCYQNAAQWSVNEDDLIHFQQEALLELSPNHKMSSNCWDSKKFAATAGFEPSSLRKWATRPHYKLEAFLGKIMWVGFYCVTATKNIGFRLYIFP